MALRARELPLTTRVGAIALLVLGAAIVFFVFVYDRLEIGSRTRIGVYFHHSAGLREHAPLVVGGQTIGRIESIETVAHGGRNPLHGEVGVVATVAIDGADAWKVSRDAEIFVASRGPLSDKYLEVAPPKHAPGPAVREGDALLAADPPSLDNVLQHTWANMTTFRLFVEQVKPELAAFRTELDALRTHLAEMAADVDALQPAVAGVGPLVTRTDELLSTARETYETSLGGEAGVARFTATIKQARLTLAQARSALDALAPRATALAANVARIRSHVDADDPVARVAQTIATMRTAIDQLDPLLAKVDEIADRFGKGEGSLGRLMHDPEFPEDAKELGKILKRQPWKVIARPKD